VKRSHLICRVVLYLDKCGRLHVCHEGWTWKTLSSWWPWVQVLPGLKLFGILKLKSVSWQSDVNCCECSCIKGFFFNLRHSKKYSWLLHWGYAVLGDGIWWFLFCRIFNCVKIYRMWLRTAWKNWTTHHHHVIMQAIHPCMKHALEVTWKSPGFCLCMGLMLVIVPLVESGNFRKNCCVVDTWNNSSLLRLIPEEICSEALLLIIMHF